MIGRIVYNQQGRIRREGRIGRFYFCCEFYSLPALNPSYWSQEEEEGMQLSTVARNTSCEHVSSVSGTGTKILPVYVSTIIHHPEEEWYIHDFTDVCVSKSVLSSRGSRENMYFGTGKKMPIRSQKQAIIHHQTITTFLTRALNPIFFIQKNGLV